MNIEPPATSIIEQLGELLSQLDETLLTDNERAEILVEAYKRITASQLTQADKDAAARLNGYASWRTWEVLQQHDDEWMMLCAQDFARHRFDQIKALENPTPELIAAIEAQFQYWKNDSSTNGPILRAHAFCQSISEHLVSPPMSASLRQPTQSDAQLDAEGAKLYWYRQGKDDGVEHERAKIVAWMRGMGLRNINYIADAIEVGEHLK